MKQKVKEEIKEMNLWKVSTIFLSVIIVLLYVLDIYETSYSNLANLTVNSEINFPQSFCSKIIGTPSWGSINGSIIANGYTEFSNITNPVHTLLIPNSIYFIYHPNCGWCQKQIQLFGEQAWEDYKDSGLTVNCVE